MKYDEIIPKAKLPVQPSNLRVLETDADGPFAIHDLSFDNKNPKLFGTKSGIDP